MAALNFSNFNWDETKKRLGMKNMGGLDVQPPVAASIAPQPVAKPEYKGGLFNPSVNRIANPGPAQSPVRQVADSAMVAGPSYNQKQAEAKFLSDNAIQDAEYMSNRERFIKTGVELGATPTIATPASRARIAAPATPVPAPVAIAPEDKTPAMKVAAPAVRSKPLAATPLGQTRRGMMARDNTILPAPPPAPESVKPAAAGGFTQSQIDKMTADAIANYSEERNNANATGTQFTDSSGVSKTWDGSKWVPDRAQSIAPAVPAIAGPAQVQGKYPDPIIREPDGTGGGRVFLPGVTGKKIDPLTGREYPLPKAPEGSVMSYGAGSDVTIKPEKSLQFSALPSGISTAKDRDGRIQVVGVKAASDEDLKNVLKRYGWNEDSSARHNGKGISVNYDSAYPAGQYLGIQNGRHIYSDDYSNEDKMIYAAASSELKSRANSTNREGTMSMLTPEQRTAVELADRGINQLGIEKELSGNALMRSQARNQDASASLGIAQAGDITAQTPSKIKLNEGNAYHAQKSGELAGAQAIEQPKLTKIRQDEVGVHQFNAKTTRGIADGSINPDGRGGKNLPPALQNSLKGYHDLVNKRNDFESREYAAWQKNSSELASINPETPVQPFTPSPVVTRMNQDIEALRSGIVSQHGYDPSTGTYGNKGPAGGGIQQPKSNLTNRKPLSSFDR